MKFKFVYLGQSILKFEVPYDIYKTINEIYESKFDKLNPANKQLVGKIKNEHDLQYKALYQYPMKLPNEKDITINNGVIEVTHSPTGCMLIKREVIEKMIKAYPEKEIVQKTIINGKMTNRPFFYNLFDTDFDPVEKTYLGEDFAFCKRWRDIGGKCHALGTEKITHVGEHQYRASFWDELSKTS